MKLLKALARVAWLCCAVIPWLALRVCWNCLRLWGLRWRRAQAYRYPARRRTQ